MNQEAKNVNEPVVHLAIGAGTTPIDVPWQDGDTVSSVIARAGIKVEPGTYPAMGKKKVKNPDAHPVQPGDLIVIAGQPRNGR